MYELQTNRTHGGDVMSGNLRLGISIAVCIAAASMALYVTCVHPDHKYTPSGTNPPDSSNLYPIGARTAPDTVTSVPDTVTPWTLPDCTSVDTPVIDTSGTEWRIILLGIRDDTVRPGWLHDGWHGYVNGEDTPRLWAFASPGNHTLCFQMMTGAEPIEVPCMIELRYTGGKP